MNGASVSALIICGIVALFSYGIRNQYPDPEDQNRRVATTTMIVAIFIGVVVVMCSLPQAGQG